jgi:hypothetical protein
MVVIVLFPASAFIWCSRMLCYFLVLFPFSPFWFTDLLCFGGCGYVLVLWWLPEVLVVQWWSCSGVHWIVCVLSWRTCGMVMVLAVWILWCGEVVSWGQRVPAVVVSPQGWIPIWSSFFDMLLDASVFAAVVALGVVLAVVLAIFLPRRRF